MSKTVTIRGVLMLGEGCGGCSGPSATEPLALGGAGGGCGCDSSLLYEEAMSFGAVVATPGLIGQTFVDIVGLNQFTAIELLRVSSSARIRLRFNPTRPQLAATVALPVGGVTAGSATITVTDSGGAQYATTVNFTGATNTPALVVGAINAAFASMGAPFPPDGLIARLSGGLLVLVCPGIGPSAFVQLAAGAPVDLGLGVVLVRATGTSQDLPDTEGLVLLQFPRAPNAPVKVQVSGTASLDIVAAGRVTA